jgi:hypothetical protein
MDGQGSVGTSMALVNPGWLNLVERWVAELTTKWLNRGTHHSVKRPRRLDPHLITNWNDEPKPYIWHKTADEILDPSPTSATGSPTQVTRRSPLALSMAP